jgi:3-oxoadipate enol-lactonase
MDMDIVIKGRRLCFAVSGAGVPCVLLHPFPFDAGYFANVVQPIESRARVILPDVRGFGGSELDGAFSIADIADDVAAILDHLRIDRAVVGGLSMGGYVSLAFAAKYPKRLAGLILADTRAGADSPEARANRDKDAALVRAAGTAAFVDKVMPRLLAPNAPEARRDEVRRLAAQPAETVIAALAALRDRPDRTAELARITCPTLVVVGTEDVMTPPTEAAAMATAIPRAVLVELAGAGHLSNLEAPTPFAQAITGFLGRVQAEISAPRQ